MSLPANRQELELYIIGMMKQKPMNYHEFSELLEPEMFLYYRPIFEYFQEVIKAGNKPDDFLIAKKHGMPFLASLDIGYFRYSFKELCLVLNQEFKKELILKMSNELTKKCNDQVDIFEIIEHMQCYVARIASIKYKEPTQIKDIIKELFDVIHNNMNSKEYVTGVHTGYKSADAFTGGWQSGDLIIVAGEAGQGKTSYAVGGVVEAAINYDVPCAIFSLEMSQLQLVARMLASYSGVSVKKILRGKLNKSEYLQFNGAIRPIEDKPIYIDPCFSADINYICSQIRTLQQTKGIKIAVVDYIQLVSNFIKGATQEQEISGISRAFKRLALELQIPIVVLSQLRRVEGNPEPALNRLKGSGAIEQDADIVLFTYRPEAYGIEKIYINGEEFSSEGKAKILWRKGRNIGTTDMLMDFKGEITKFVDVGQNWVREPEPLEF